MSLSYAWNTILHIASLYHIKLPFSFKTEESICFNALIRFGGSAVHQYDVRFLL